MAGALALRLVIAWTDYGFVAVDDHNHVLVDAVPAQQIPGASSVIDSSGVRSPLPRLFIFGLGQIAHRLGMEDPIAQIRWIYSVLGLLSMVAVWLVWELYTRLERKSWGIHAVIWTGFHFLAVFISTRALIENMAVPFLTLSGVLLVFYLQRGSAWWLSGSLLALSVASLFRFQAGICVMVLFAVPIVKRAWRDLSISAVVGLGLFVVTGWIDYLLRGSFHGTLRAYVAFNLQYSSSTFGVSAWYNYLLLLVAASLPPLLVARYRSFPWREYARKLWPIIALVGVFVASHSAVPHKEDRFMIPIFPLYLALLAPLSAWVFARKPISWRSIGFVVLNGAMIALIAVSPTQNNVIALVRYLGDQPHIRTLWAIRDSLEVYPVAYSAGELPELHRLNVLPPRAVEVHGCGAAVAVRKDLLNWARPQLEGLREAAVFQPGILEELLISANPRRNVRRSAVHLFVPQGCPN
jgi:hypothetical protein